MKSKKLWIGLIIIGVILVGLYLFGSYFFSEQLINRPTQSLATSQERMGELGVPTIALPQPEAVTIENGDVSLAGNFYENPLAGDCAVLMLHGYTGTRYGTLQYAPLFWDRGCDLLAYDARGHGESSAAYHTYGYFEKDDGLAAYEWLQARTGLPASDIALAGVSYGAATSLQMLPLVPDVAFVLADSPYESLEAIVTHQAVAQFGTWVNLFVPGAFFVSEMRTGLDKEAVSPKDAVAGAAVPVLLMHSKTDEFTPSIESEAIYANSNQATTELHINEWGAEHAGDIIIDYAAYEQIVDRFLDEYAPEFGLSDGR